MTQLPLAAICKPLVQVVTDLLITKPVVTVKAGLPRVSVFPVLLIRVMEVAMPATPTGSLAKATVLGLRITLLVPVPLTPAICGLVGSLSLMMTAPFFAPVVFGSKATPILQLAPPASVFPDAGQVLDLMAKSLVSLRVMAPIVMAPVPLFVTVTVFVALAVFTSCEPKLTGTPERVMAVPIPVRLTEERALKKPLSLMVTLPLLVPPAVGEK